MWTGLQPGISEPLKRNVHTALGVLTAVCFFYSVAAFHARKDRPVRERRHLIINAVLYGGVTSIEVIHVTHHCQKRIPCEH